MTKPEFDESMLYGEDTPLEQLPSITTYLQESDSQAGIDFAEKDGQHYHRQKRDE